MNPAIMKRLEKTEQATAARSANPYAHMSDAEFRIFYAAKVEEYRAAGDMDMVKLMTGPEEDMMAVLEAHYAEHGL